MSESQHSSKDRFSFLFVGLGSIARRHAAVLHSMGHQVAGVDPRFRKELWDDRASPLAGRFKTMEEAWSVRDHFDAVAICTPSALHLSQVDFWSRAQKPIFVEKPASSLDSVRSQSRYERPFEKDVRIWVGCNFRFHPMTTAISRWKRDHQVRMVRGEALLYLPQWHPWADYRQEYSARKDLGGGVALDMIHETDLLLWLLGDPDPMTVRAIGWNTGLLETNTEDWAHLSWRSVNGTYVDLSFSYVFRQQRRQLRWLSDDAELLVDWLEGTVVETQPDGSEVELLSMNPAEAFDQMYHEQWKSFLRWMREGASAKALSETQGCSWSSGMKAVDLNLEIQRSLRGDS